MYNDTPSDLERDYIANGLNQYTEVGGLAYDYDANGNLIAAGGDTYVYDVENRLVSAEVNGSDIELEYDPFGRLYQYDADGSATRRMLYDGDALVAEYETNGDLMYRAIHGPGAGDDPLVLWLNSGTSPAKRGS